MVYYDGSDGKGEWWDAEPMDRVLYEALEVSNFIRNSLISDAERLDFIQWMVRRNGGKD